MGTPPGDHPIRILVAEDNEAVRDVLETVLADEGYHVLPAVDGEQALAVALAEEPDLVAIALGTPRLDGAGFCLAYREAGGRVPVILISAAPSNKVEAAVEACGAAAYISKPFDMDVLLDTIDGVVGR